MNKRMIHLSIIACIASMIGAVTYAFVRLYGLNQRIDLSIILVNGIIFVACAISLIFLFKKEHDMEEEELFRD